MYPSSIFAALVQAEESGAVDSILQSLPSDPASIFALLLVLVVAGAVLWYGRPRGGGGTQA